MVMANSGIGFNPEYENLKEELQNYRSQYADLLISFDELQNIILPNLEAEYMMSLGNKEHRNFTVYVKILQCKREINLYQTAINHGKKITRKEVNSIIELEFKQYQEQLAEQIKKIKEAETIYVAEKLSADEQKTIKKLYYDLVRKLHPDLNNNLTEKEIKLWHKVVEAYKNCDWQALYLFNDMADEFLQGKEQDFKLLDDNLADKICAIKEKIDKLNLRIDEIKSKHPYNLREFLSEPKLVMAKREELDQQFIKYNETLEELQKMLEVLTINIGEE